MNRNIKGGFLTLSGVVGIVGMIIVAMQNPATAWVTPPGRMIVFVLDEPSSNLDAYSIADFRKLLKILKSQGKTIIIAEHRLYYLYDLADRIIYLSDGEIQGDYGGSDCG